MRQEIDDPRKYRVSMSGFSIRTGWGNEKRTVAKYPGQVRPLDAAAYQQWLDDAEKICEQHNAALTPNVNVTGATQLHRGASVLTAGLAGTGETE